MQCTYSTIWEKMNIDIPSADKRELPSKSIGHSSGAFYTDREILTCGVGLNPWHISLASPSEARTGRHSTCPRNPACRRCFAPPSTMPFLGIGMARLHQGMATGHWLHLLERAALAKPWQLTSSYAMPEQLQVCAIILPLFGFWSRLMRKGRRPGLH